MIYHESPGPIFFGQTRIGKNGKKFTCYKFRSMYLDAEERKAALAAENRVSDGMMFKLDFDPAHHRQQASAGRDDKKGAWK